MFSCVHLVVFLELIMVLAKYITPPSVIKAIGHMNLLLSNYCIHE